MSREVQMIRKMRFALVLLVSLVSAIGRLTAEEKNSDLSWSLFGEARFRPEWRNNADLNDQAGDDLRQSFMRVRLGLRLAHKEDYRVVLQFQDSRVAGEEVSTASNEKNLDLHQGYLEMGTGSRKQVTWFIGRQEWKYGDERLVGSFGWDNVGRSFDGVRARYARPRFWLDALAARVTRRKVAGATTGSELYGFYSQVAPHTGAEYEGFWLEYHDHMETAGEGGLPGTTRIDAVGVRAKDRFGRFDYAAEIVYEKGRLAGDDLSARAAAAQAGLTWGSKTKIRTFGGYDFATGDRNPTDGKRQEFFNFFPTNHPYYGYMDYEGWRNLRSPCVGAAVMRGRHFGQVKVHNFGLNEARGPWKDAGGNVLGSDPAGASGTSVGREIDLTYRFALREKASLEGGYSRLNPGRFARLTRGSDPSDWAYVMLAVAF